MIPSSCSPTELSLLFGSVPQNRSYIRLQQKEDTAKNWLHSILSLQFDFILIRIHMLNLPNKVAAEESFAEVKKLLKRTEKAPF